MDVKKVRRGSTYIPFREVLTFDSKEQARKEFDRLQHEKPLPHQADRLCSRSCIGPGWAIFEKLK